jgi:hypothetical protein
MRGIKILIGATALLAGLALAPAAPAQIYVNLGVPPVCEYGYYGYTPYACAPYGYYGPGYFYNGIFLGMGPWGGWGYGHGWGGHRFVSEGGGSYHGGPGNVSAYRSSGGQSRGSVATASSGGARPSAGHAAVVHTSAPRAAQASAVHTSAPRASVSHASAPRASASHAAPSGGGSHGGGGGGHEGGGGGRSGGGKH